MQKNTPIKTAMALPYELWSTTDFDLPEGYKEDEFKDVKELW